MREKIKFYSLLHLPARSPLQVLEKVKIKWLPDLAIDAAKASSQSLDSSFSEAKIVANRIWPYAAVLVYFRFHSVSRNFYLSLSSDNFYILTA